MLLTSSEAKRSEAKRSETPMSSLTFGLLTDPVSRVAGGEEEDDDAEERAKKEKRCGSDGSCKKIKARVHDDQLRQF